MADKKSYSVEKASEEGFTLIELSIVLVIIGLIVGGILVGQDMIKAAEIRATIAQVEKLDAAVNTFRNKFGGNPGDLLNATNFGFTARTSNGDGLVQGCTGESGGSSTETTMQFGCADKFFWNDLSTANLIPESFTDTGGATSAPSSISGSFASYLEQAKIGMSNSLFVWGNGSTGLNYIHIRNINNLSAGTAQSSLSVTPYTALQIDQKMDDGVPNSGSVQALNDIDGTPLLTTGAGACATASNIYNANPTYGNNQLCELQIRASF